ncbi:MAG: O-antigen ligase family protein, partial [Haliea sp.]|uniref:O-antigen ligase family protein n=1 Tax=Haliea sp. TaxID=1932666 RepID=UPI0032EBFEBC
MIPSARGQQLLAGLAVAGFAGSLVYSSLLTTAVVLIAAAGCAPALRQQLRASGWDRPRELRLLHFACWFPVLVYVLFWIDSGFDYRALKELDGPGRLVLFWPLLLALSWSGLDARRLFAGFALMALGAALHTGASLCLAPPSGEPLRVGLWINPITLGNLALLAAAALLSAALFWHRLQQPVRVWLALGLAGLALAAALLTQTRNNLLALPLLLVVLSLQLPVRQRALVLLAGAALLLLTVAGNHRFLDTLSGLQLGELDMPVASRLAVWDIAWEQFANHPWTGSGLNGYQTAVQDALETGEFAETAF